MNVPRESIFVALLAQIGTAQLAGQPAFLTLSRKFQQWENVPAVMQPAAYLGKGFENASQSPTYGLTKWRMRGVLWIYCQHSPDSESVPGTNLNDLLDAVEAALKPKDVFDHQTLGGLISHCFIDGEVLITEGSLPEDTQSIAVVPITIETGI